MQRTTLALRVGALACLALLALLAAPYALFDAATVQVYYGVGPVSPLVVALFAGVAFVALGSAAAGRADTATVAGLALVVGVGAVLITLSWALSAAGVTGGLPTSAAFGYHRWGLVAVSAALALAGLFASPLGDAKGP
ncbi:MAG: hypothetical protein ABEJ68_05885 [Halobacteriaceae archaeon]